MNRNQCLNAGKGIACILIILIHVCFPGILGIVLLRIGALGVPFFFMISGYYSPKQNNLNSNKMFAKKILKILKILVLSLILYITFAVSRSEFDKMNWIEIVRSGLLRFDFSLIGCEHLWFLCGLIICYMIHALLIYIKRESCVEKLIVVLAAIMLFTPVHEEYQYIERTLFPGFLMYLVGVSIRNKSEKHLKISDKALVLIFIVGVVVYLFGSFITDEIRIFHPYIYMATYAAFVAAQKHPNYANHTIIAYIGEYMSLIIYI